MSEETTNPMGIDDDGTIKIDLRQNAVQEQSTDEVPVRDEPAVSEEVPVENLEATTEEPAGENAVQNEEPVPDVQQKALEEEPVLMEITEEQVEQATEQLQDQVADAVEEAAQSGVELTRKHSKSC
jgi:hypothetical protein